MLKWFPLFLTPVLLFAEETALPEIQTSRFFYEFIKMLGVLGIMVAVLLGLSWYMRRLTGQRFEKVNDESLIKVIDRRSISQKTIIYLLEVEGKSLVVGETPQGLVRLSEEK
ncbi:MAG: flagellar biosynthetic protein FliO [Chlamydiia bacterium]|nr:flagellar biosynthetic protein FliO [Chlamydiia bacterium]